MRTGMFNLGRECILMFLIVLAASLFAFDTHAEDKKQKKKTSINFEDQLVRGTSQKPELIYLLQKKQFNFERLIKLRENFIPEMRQSAEEFRRGGGDD